MARPSDSFKQFDYSLRPSKQVERKVMIEVLLGLSKAHYDIGGYVYLGFGSPYYADFIMFHKYLFMQNMVCVEWADVKMRMRFNKPFKCVKLRLEPFSSFIPRIQSTKKYFVWLDFDRSLDKETLQDIDGCLTRIAAGSIFVITVDARPKLPRDQFEFDIDEMTAEEREMLTAKTYHDWFRPYVETKVTRDMVSGSHVARLFYEIIVERIKQTLTRRGGGLHLVQLFNYMYRDGAPMLSLGGMIGTQTDEQGLRDAGILTHRFVRTGADWLEISVPPLTFREKQWLDSRVDEKLTVANLRFELEEELLNSYRNFYKQYPTYIESLL